MSASSSCSGGGCSRAPGNGGEDGEDRPLKKARYAWQVKGKCRTRSDDASSSSAPVPASAEQNLEVLGGYLLTLRDPTEGPVSLVAYARHTEEDCYLKEWQSTQMAMGNVDNTINSVLDSWVTPQQRMADLYQVALLTDPENVLPASPSVENEGILMAISAHGLQHTSVPSAIMESSDSDSEISEDSEFSNSRTTADDVATPLAEPEHAHIIEEAIAFAIQNKGLCWGYDYHNDVLINNRSSD